MIHPRPGVSWLRRARRRAIAATEFALLFPVLALIVASVIDLTEYLTIYKVLALAARNAALDAGGVTSVAGVTPSMSDLTSTAINAVDGTLSDSGYNCGEGCEVSADWNPSTTTGWYLLTVTVSWEYESLTGLNTLLDGTMQARFTTLTQHQP